MRKRTLILLSLMILTVALSGCARRLREESEKNAQSQTQTETEEPTEAEPALDLASWLVPHASDYVTLGDFSNLTVEKPVYDVTSADVENQIQSLLLTFAEHKEVSRSIRSSDSVIMNLKASVNGKEYFDETDWEIILEDEEFGPEFSRQLIGHKKGDTLNFSIKYSEDTGYRDWVDQTVDFTVTVTSVIETTLPILNDAFVGEKFGYPSVSELRAVLLDELTSVNEKLSQAEARENVLRTAAALSTFNGYPEELYQRCVELYGQEYSLTGIGSDPMIEYEEEEDLISAETSAAENAKPSDTASKAASGAADALTGAEPETADTLSGTEDTLREAASEAGDTISETVSEVTDTLSEEAAEAPDALSETDSDESNAGGEADDAGNADDLKATVITTTDEYSEEEFMDIPLFVEDESTDPILDLINRTLLVSAICQANNLVLNQGEYDDYISTRYKDYGYGDSDSFRKAYASRPLVLLGEIYTEKAADFLLKNATITESAYSFSEEDLSVDNDVTGNIDEVTSALEAAGIPVQYAVEPDAPEVDPEKDTDTDDDLEEIVAGESISAYTDSADNGSADTDAADNGSADTDSADNGAPEETQAATEPA